MSDKDNGLATWAEQVRKELKGRRIVGGAGYGHAPDTLRGAGDGLLLLGTTSKLPLHTIMLLTRIWLLGRWVQPRR